MEKFFKLPLAIFICLLCFASGFLYCANFNTTRKTLNLIFSTVIGSTENTPIIGKKTSIDSVFQGYNNTHLWSWKLADQTYDRIARILPCRTVNYTHAQRSGTIDTCDESSNNEFSLSNSIRAQKWIYEHQHPVDCSNKRFAIIHRTAPSGFGSTLHQVAWAFGIALAQNRIAVYKSPGNWLYGDCDSVNPDCIFLPISHCPVPTNVDGDKTIYIRADFGYWGKPEYPPVFQNRSFNWYRAQLIFYIMRYKPNILAHVQNVITQNFNPPSVEQHRPYIAVYVRRSDKVQFREMSQAYTLRQYFDLFENDTRRAKISTVYLNSEDEHVFSEFNEINKEKQGYYKLITIKTTKNVVYRKMTRMPRAQRGKIVLEFLTDLYIEANADLHAGTLTSNWCRLVDEIRLVLGKKIPYYTPEKRLLMDG